MATALELRRSTARAGGQAHRPALGALQATLRKTTEELVRELASSGELAPAWSPFEWLIARAVAAMHGVSALLAGKLRWRGPDTWSEFLEQQRAHTLNRHRRIQELLLAIDQAGGRQDISLVGLKGAALHGLGLYAPGERPMADVDLLVRRGDFRRASAMIESLGFRLTLVNWKHHVFVAPGHQAPRALGEHSDNYLKIELHEDIRERLPLHPVGVSCSVFPHEPRPGLNGYRSKAALLSHLLLHAAGCMVQRDLRALHLNDLALLCRDMSNEDWREFLDLSAHNRSHWWAFPPLRLVSVYYHVPTLGILGLAERCPLFLRTITSRRKLSDVSLSHLWITAFPGIEWSQSVLEAAAYVHSRLRPSAESLCVRQELGKTHVAAAATAWQGLSQSARVIRWLTSRKSRARADTLHAVRTALAQS